MTRPDRNDAAAFASIRDRAQTEARRKLSWGQKVHARTLRRYEWFLKEAVGGDEPVTVATGRCITKSGADRAWYRTYLAELNHDHRARPAVETSPAANRFRPWVR